MGGTLKIPEEGSGHFGARYGFGTMYAPNCPEQYYKAQYLYKD